MAQGPRDREHDPERDDRCQRRRVQRPPVRAGGGLMLELVAGGELVAERQCHGDIRAEMHRMPRPIPEAAAHQDDRRHDHRDEDPQRDRRQQHARVAREQVAQLAAERDAVLERVTGRDERRVRDDEREARDAVAPVPRADALEADPVEHGDACEQQELHEREERAQQPRDAAEAREQPGGVAHLADAALAPPEPGDRDRVGRDEHRHVPAGDPPPHAHGIPLRHRF